MAEPIFVPDTQCNYDVTSLPHHSALLSGIRACLRANTERDAVSSACKAMKNWSGGEPARDYFDASYPGLVAAYLSSKARRISARFLETCRLYYPAKQ